jgi:hypothetical protein
LAAIALRKLARTAPEARDQCLPPSRENASRAAATAISTSSAVPAGMSPSRIPISDYHHNKKVEFSTVLGCLLGCCRYDVKAIGERGGGGGGEPRRGVVRGRGGVGVRRGKKGGRE